MKPRAVIFDLFGTLASEDPQAYGTVVAEMSRALTTNQFEFASTWEAVVREREASGGGTLEGDIYQALRYLLVFTHLEQVRAAVDLMLAFERERLLPRPGAIGLLERLRAASVKVGVVANAVPRIAIRWRDSELGRLVDAAVFSCQAGRRLPDAGIIAAAPEALRVSPQDCLFVSDDSAALEAAAKLGMHTLTVDSPAEDLDYVLQSATKEEQ